MEIKSKRIKLLLITMPSWVALTKMTPSLVPTTVYANRINGRRKLQKAKSNNLRFCEFKLSLINQMISHKMEIHHSIPRKCGRHYIEKIPVTGKTTRPTRQCVHCSKQNHRKESRYQCGDCHLTPSLCIIPCFKEYHS